MLTNRVSSRRPRSSSPAHLEMLEPRMLLSGLISYSTGSSGPGQLAADNSGNLWATDSFGFDKITKTNGTLNITTISPAILSTGQIALGPIAYSAADNTLWMADSSGNASTLYHFDTSGNLLGTYVPGANTSYIANAENITSLAVASDGSIWFGTSGFNGTDNTAEIGRLDPQTGNFNFVSLPNGALTPAIHAAPDGTFWFTSLFSNDPTMLSNVNQVQWTGSSLQLTTYNLPDSTDQIGDLAVISANDGNPGDYTVWYTESAHQFASSGPSNDVYPDVPGQLNSVVVSNGQPALTQITSLLGNSTQLTVTSYAIPAGDHSALLPFPISVDSSGTLWFTELDYTDLVNNEVDPQTALPITNSLDSFNTSTGDFARIPMGQAEGFFTAVSGSDVWVEALPSLGGQFSNGDYEELDNVDLTTPQPIESTDPSFAATTGQTFSGPIATFVSSDGGVFTYTLTYGNGTTSSGIIPNDPSGIYTVNGNVTYAADGTYATSLTITSATGDIAIFNGQAVATSSVPLMAQGVNVQGEKDIALAANVSGQSSLVVAQFSGAPASYTATIKWGDNTSTTAQIVSAGNDQYYVEVPAGTSKTYHAIGNFTITTTITDGTNTVTALATAAIGAVPVVASQNLVLQPLLGPIVLGVVATFTADPLSTSAWFKATIHWGDGSTSTGLVIRTSAGNYEVIGLHIYRKKGTYTVDTNLIDSVDTETALATASIKITQ